MKAIKSYILVLLGAFTLGSCAYDNYEAPDAKLEGRLVYQGEPLNLDARDVNMELWEPGWKKKSKMNVQVDQTGSFSALLFNGSYRLYIPPNPVPFRIAPKDQMIGDSVVVEMNGNKTMDIEVTPYYLVKNASITNAGRTINASFAIEKIITDANAKNVDEVFLYVSRSNMVSARNDIGGVTSIKGADITDLSNLTLSRTVQDLTPMPPYVFARIGVKLADVQYLIFSPVQKITL